MNTELIPSEQATPTGPPPLPGEYSARRNLLRLKIFALTFLVVAAAGLGYSYLQPTTYRSQATLMASSGGPLDLPDSGTPEQQAASLSQALFNNATIEKVQSSLSSAGYPGLASAEIRSMLGVQVVADSKLVEISAQGSEPDVLPVIINSWIDSYLETVAAAGEEKPQAPADQSVPDELVQLQQKIMQARGELEGFREEHQISASQWDQGEARAALGELKSQLSSATRQEQAAEAALLAAQKDIARGNTILARDDQGELKNLQRKLDALETQLADLDARYTRQFLSLNPKLRDLPERVESLQVEVERFEAEGQKKMLDQLRMDHRAALQAVAVAQRQIDDHEQRERDFSSVAAEHTARLDALKKLEQLSQETRARLAQFGDLPVASYPQVSVINRASGSAAQTGTDGSQNALLALAGALGAALTAAWVYGFLNPLHAAVTLTQRGESTEADPEQPQLHLAFQPPDNAPSAQDGPDLKRNEQGPADLS